MNIVIVTFAKFPEGDAESVRLHTIGRLLREIGYDVTYVGMGFSNYLENMVYDGFTYTSLRKGNNSKFNKLYYYFSYNKRLRKYLCLYLSKNKLDAILFADIFPITINMLKKICKRKDIQLISDSVEWYSPEQFKFGSLSPSMILKNIENKYVIDKTIKVIAISNYLYKHFKKKGCTCIRVPVILDVKSMSYAKNIDFDKFIILYAGSPGRKDYVDEMLRGILFLNENEINKLRFELAGVSLNDIQCLFTSDELLKLNKCITFLGRVDRNVVLEKLSKADSTVLIRSPYQRYSKAGFPTKVVESLATATPVILNLTSDLSYYMNDMQNSIIVSSCTAYDFSLALKKVIYLTREKRKEMYIYARKCAEENFDYRKYMLTIKKFLED